MDVLARQAGLIDRLASSLAADGRLEEYETHLSRVLVTRDYAYKFKKALWLSFADFSTLAARRFYCGEECRLNRRLAPELYVDVVQVGASAGRPVLGGAGPALEYAVRMHVFEQRDLWSARIAQGVLGEEEVDAPAQLLARFHRDAAGAPPDSGWGGDYDGLRVLAYYRMHRALVRAKVLLLRAGQPGASSDRERSREEGLPAWPSPAAACVPARPP